MLNVLLSVILEMKAQVKMQMFILIIIFSKHVKSKSFVSYQSNFDPGLSPLQTGVAAFTHSDSNLSNSHSPPRSIHGISFSKPTLLLSFSICVFHVFFGCPRFLLPFTSSSNAFLKTCPSSLLNTCPYHLTPFAFAI